MHLHHLCIQTHDYAASFAFYCDVLGATLVKETPNFHGRDFNTWLDCGSFMIELQTPKRPTQFSEFSKTARGIAHFCLLVENVDDLVATIQAKGYSHFQLKHNSIIYQVEGSALAKLIAPEGTIIELRDVASL